MALIRIDHDPGPRQLAVFGAAWLAAGALAGLAATRHGHAAAAEAIWTAAAAVPVGGLLWRPLLRGAYAGLSFATFPAGVVVSYAALAIVYFLVLTPIGLAMRLLGRDPLQRAAAPGADTYWKKRGPAREPRSYFEQG